VPSRGFVMTFSFLRFWVCVLQQKALSLWTFSSCTPQHLFDSQGFIFVFYGNPITFCFTKTLLFWNVALALHNFKFIKVSFHHHLFLFLFFAWFFVCHACACSCLRQVFVSFLFLFFCSFVFACNNYNLIVVIF
jgi:hypothetical protein